MTLRLGSGVGASFALLLVGEPTNEGDRAPESLLVTNDVEAVSLRVSTQEVIASAT